MDGAQRRVTVLLDRWGQGDRAAFDALVPLIYDELRRVAANHLRGERRGHSLCPTELVAEACVRLIGATPPEGWNGRVHFFAIAARSMRQILVDHARRHGAGKRGAGQRPVTLDEAVACADRSDDLIAVDHALEALAKVDARKARVVELCHFGGLTQSEIAQVLDIHVNTVARDLRMGEAWLHRHLRG